MLKGRKSIESLRRIGEPAEGGGLRREGTAPPLVCKAVYLTWGYEPNYVGGVGNSGLPDMGS